MRTVLKTFLGVVLLSVGMASYSMTAPNTKNTCFIRYVDVTWVSDGSNMGQDMSPNITLPCACANVVVSNKNYSGGTEGTALHVERINGSNWIDFSPHCNT